MRAKFKIGDDVLLNGEAGKIAGVSGHPELTPDGGRSYLYGVALTPWTRVEKVYLAADGDEIKRVWYEHPETHERRDHAVDTLGCIPEDALESAP